MKILVSSAVIAALACGQGALAQPPTDTSLVVHDVTPAAEPAIDIEGAGVEAVAVAEADAPLQLDELADLRGGEATGFQLTNQNLNAINTGNSVSAGDSIGSGSVNLNAGALSNYNGIGNFVINTGHNNNLLGSVSVNVMVTPQ